MRVPLLRATIGTEVAIADLTDAGIKLTIEGRLGE